MRIPIASAAMDRVTEHKLAIELAMEGGIGIIHKNLTPKKQAWEVSRVKRRISSYIEDPICVLDDETVGAIIKRKEKKDYRFRSFPVLDKKGKLVGIVTANDFDFCDDNSLTIGKIMTRDPDHFIGKCSYEEAYQRMKQIKKKAIPVADRR